VTVGAEIFVCLSLPIPTLALSGRSAARFAMGPDLRRGFVPAREVDHSEAGRRRLPQPDLDQPKRQGVRTPKVRHEAANGIGGDVAVG
jgi:hypothetical protein